MSLNLGEVVTPIWPSACLPHYTVERSRTRLNKSNVCESQRPVTVSHSNKSEHDTMKTKWLLCHGSWFSERQFSITPHPTCRWITSSACIATGHIRTLGTSHILCLVTQASDVGGWHGNRQAGHCNRHMSKSILALKSVPFKVINTVSHPWNTEVWEWRVLLIGNEVYEFCFNYLGLSDLTDTKHIKKVGQISLLYHLISLATV